jgi:hypothetical protein
MKNLQKTGFKIQQAVPDNDFNLLKPTGHVMHQQFPHSTIVRSAHTVFMRFVFI